LSISSAASAGVTKSLAALALLLLCRATPAEPHIALDSPLWRLESDDAGILLYSSRVEGTSIVPFKAVMSIPASIEEVAAVLEDMPRRSEWVARFGGSVLLERRGDYDRTEYVLMRMPWPLSDRTARVRVSVSVSDDRSLVSIVGRSVRSPRRPDLPEFVRAEVYESTFQMVKRARSTEVTALAFVDPRGNLPKWVVNLFTGGEARRTLQGLRRQVERNLYGPAVLADIRARIRRFEGSAAQLR
jgi:hypothetical protein